MKVIALMPVKNEEWILKYTIPHLRKFADEILCLDAGSTDGTVEYLKSAGAHVKQQTEKKTNYSAWRRELLEWGRARGGTHFIWLDADEAFTSNFLSSFREQLACMKRGEKLALRWLCLWKNSRVYRDDTSVWGNLYKDFIICDDPKATFPETLVHEGRTPGANQNPDGTLVWTKVPLDKGAVLHFQFVPFERFQVKQSYQRMREYIMGNGSAWRINNKYAATLDDPTARTKNIPAEWLAGIEGLDTIKNSKESWYMQGALDFFKEKGVEYFEPLQIWHVPELCEVFVKKMRRQPKPRTAPAFVVKLNSLKNKIRDRFTNLKKHDQKDQ